MSSMSSISAAPAIRAATVHDAPELARLLTMLGHPTEAAPIVSYWDEWAAGGDAAVVAVAGDGSLMGVATLHHMRVLHRPRPVGRITALVVDERVRGQGIGRALVAAAERTLRSAGCGLLEVTSNMRRVEAHAFYERLGYERTSFRFMKVLTNDE